MTDHTPTPWAAVPGEESVIYSPQAGGRAVARTLANPDPTWPAEANAAFIVRACNAHDEMLAALKELIEANAAAVPKPGETGLERNDRWHARRNAAFAAARAAIAKAEAQP